MKIVLKLVLVVVIIILGYLVYESVMSTVRFNKEKDARYAKTILVMKDIRQVQRFYKAQNQSYAPNFDSLLTFAKNGEIPVVMMVPDPEDTTFTRSIRDTIDFIPVGDSLFGKRAGFNLQMLRYVPFSGNVEFSMTSDTIRKGGVKIPVYEVTASNGDILKGMKKQMIINLNDKAESVERYPGLKMGSLTEVSTDGNWE